MTYFEDLSPCLYFGLRKSPLLAVGWLEEPRVDPVNCYGQTPLHLCARLADGYGTNAKIIDYLLASGSDANKQDKEGWSVLHHLSDCDNVEIYQTMVDHGANPWLKNSDGETVFDLLKEPRVFELDNVELVAKVLLHVPHFGQH